MTMRFLSALALTLLSGCSSIAVGHVVGGEAGSTAAAGNAAVAGSAGSSGADTATGGQPGAGSTGSAGTPTAGAPAQGGSAGSAADACQGADEYFDAASGHCYWFNGDHLSFDDAQGVCVGWGGTLASITSDEERVFLYAANLSAPATWIGLRSPAANQPYGWLSGEPLVYTQWAYAEPNYDNGLGPTELCGAMHPASWSPPYAWFDSYCTYQNPSLCEKAL
jgi:hypothetical protein